MTRKALIVGVSDYTPLAPDVPSSTIESVLWRDLLVRQYAFDPRQIRLVTNYSATRQSILDRLVWLLACAAPGDQLVFVFSGHGWRLRRESAGTVLHESLLAYPAGAEDPMSIAIFDDELATLFSSIAVSEHAVLTLILNCCHAGGIDFHEKPSFGDQFAQALKLANENATANVVLFGSRGGKDAAPVRPLVVAATRGTNNAFQQDPENRSLFSKLALEALEHNPALTYSELVDAISPRMLQAKQEPCLIGDEARKHATFLQ